jgi:hypothetical protein
MSIIVNSMWGFIFALMKCSYAAFGEQNKTENDSKCQLVCKSLKKACKGIENFALMQEKSQYLYFFV